MAYVVNTRWSQQAFEDPGSAAEFISQDDDYITEYNDYDPDDDLNETYGSITVYGNTYYAADILRSMDEDEYDEYACNMRRELAENSEEDIEYQIDQLSPGESISFYGGITVTYEDDIDDNDATSADGFAEVFDYAM